MNKTSIQSYGLSLIIHILIISTVFLFSNTASSTERRIPVQFTEVRQNFEHQPGIAGSVSANPPLSGRQVPYESPQSAEEPVRYPERIAPAFPQHREDLLVQNLEPSQQSRSAYQSTLPNAAEHTQIPLDQLLMEEDPLETDRHEQGQSAYSIEIGTTGIREVVHQPQIRLPDISSETPVLSKLIITFSILPDGRVSDLDVLQSTGLPEIDARVCQYMRQYLFSEHTETTSEALVEFTVIPARGNQ
ncbi:MAG: energy transducer TonB [Spirochaetia bacterium]